MTGDRKEAATRLTSVRQPHLLFVSQNLRKLTAEQYTNASAELPAETRKLSNALSKLDEDHRDSNRQGKKLLKAQNYGVEKI